MLSVFCFLFHFWLIVTVLFSCWVEEALHKLPWDPLYSIYEGFGVVLVEESIYYGSLLEETVRHYEEGMAAYSRCS